MKAILISIILLVSSIATADLMFFDVERAECVPVPMVDGQKITPMFLVERGGCESRVNYKGIWYVDCKKTAIGNEYLYSTTEQGCYELSNIYQILESQGQ